MRERIYRVVGSVLKLVKGIEWRTAGLGDARDQLVRAATSIGANYIEAIAATTTNEFSRFIGHSLRSANETQYWLHLIEENIDGSKTSGITEIKNEVIQLSKILATSIKTMRTNTFIKKNIFTQQ